MIDPTIDPDSEKLELGAYTEITLEEANSKRTNGVTPRSMPDVSLEITQRDLNIVANRPNDLFNGKQQAMVASSAVIEDEFIGYNSAQTEAYGYFVLYPQELMQLGMECPTAKTLDYDLYLYEYNTATGDLTLVDSSTYTTYTEEANNGITLDEGVSIINKTNEIKAYILGVYSRTEVDPSKPYTIYYSIDTYGNYNFGENDQNAKTPCTSIQPGQYVSGLAMNSRSDNDWFGFQVTIPNAYVHIEVQLTAGTNKVELYKEVASGTMKMAKVLPSKGSNYYKFYATDIYYIRVIPTSRPSHTWNLYQLNASITETSGKPHTVSITGYECEDFSPDNWVLWPQGNHYCYSGDWLKVHGQVFDVFGDGVYAGHALYSLWESNAWPESTGNKYRESFSETVAGGYFTIEHNQLPACIWDKQYFNAYSNFIHYYSTCEVGVASIAYDTKTATDTIYMWSHAIQAN